MASVSNDLADAQRQIVRLKSEIEDQSANLTQQMQWMSKLKETMSERESRNKALQEKVEALNTQLESSNGDLEAEQSSRRAIEAEKSATERKAAENQARIEEAEAITAEQQLSNSVYTNIIAARDAKIEALKQDLQQQQTVDDKETETETETETGKMQAAVLSVVPPEEPGSQENSALPIAGRRGLTRIHLLPRSRVQSLRVQRKSSSRMKSRKAQNRRALRSVVRG